MWKQLRAKKSIDHAPTDRAGGELKRSLGAFQLTNLGIGAIIGAGIFVLAGKAAAEYAGPAVVLSCAFAALICLLAALCYAELAAVIPVSGGVYSYVYVIMGELAAWIVGWGLTLEFLFSAATVAVGWSGYFNSICSDLGLKIPAIVAGAPLLYDPATGWAFTGSLINLPAVMIVLFLGILVARGVKGAAKVNNILVVVKMLVIAIFIVLGALYINPDNWHPFLPENTGLFGQFGWSGVLRGAGVMFFAFIGFDALSTMAQETKNPQRDLPLGMIGSLGISTAVYMLLVLVLTGLVSYKALAVPDPIAVALAALGPKFAFLRLFMNLAILAALTSVVMVMLMSQTRVFYSMASDKLMPPAFARVHPRFGTPFSGTLVVTLVCALVAGLFPVEILGQLVSMGTLMAFAFVCFGVLLLRRSAPKLPRPFRTPWVPFVPVAGTLICLFQMALLPGVTWIQALVWMAIGLAIYFFYGIRHSKMRG